MTRSRRLTTVVLTLVLVVGSFGAAQSLSDDAVRSTSLARALLDTAIAQDAPAFPDQPLWAKAIVVARAAAAQAPSDAQALGLLAEAYSRSGYSGPAWTAWTNYLGAGHALEPEQMPLFLEIGEQLAYTAYDRGDLDRAAALHSELLDTVPFSKESRVWLARIRMEQGRPIDAIPYWEAVLAQDPEDARAQYFLGLAEDQVRWGIDAANAFRNGIAHYEAGAMSEARRAFERATDLNPSYGEAWAWRGRIAFENESWLVAQRHYARAVDLAPSVDAYRYFRDEAQRRLEPVDDADDEAADEPADDAAVDEP